MLGAAGRMGRTILKLASQDPEFQIVGGLESADSPAIGTDIGTMLGLNPLGVSVSSDLEAAFEKADAVIDFTHFSATQKNAETAAKTKTGYVVGTTGLSQEGLAAIAKASSQIPVVQSPNMSIGVNLLFKLSEIAATILDETYDIEIVEAHHRNKKDSPSGTAMKLLEIVAAARKKSLEKDTVYGRQGEVGARPKGEIGVLAVRGGDVVGDHNVSYLGDGERIELIHRASSREAFAKGALSAAKYVSRAEAGLYTMTDVLGF